MLCPPSKDKNAPKRLLVEELDHALFSSPTDPVQLKRKVA